MIVPYLSELGISHVYASPYLKATAGSTHGYDVIDHNKLNPELGTDAEYEAFLRTLEEHGLSHILDTVPNHAGVATNDNAWWNDLLLHGPASAYAGYFDIAWRGSPRLELHNKLLVPVLGGAYGEVLERGELKISFDEQQGGFHVHYFERRFPVNVEGIAAILTLPTDAGGEGIGELRDILAMAGRIPPMDDCDPIHQEERRRQTIHIHGRLADVTHRSANIRKHIEDAVQTINGRIGDPRSFDHLDVILSKQAYRLTYWRNASDEINYRRFFDINDLAALSMEREDVFLATHELLLKLLAENKIAGVRVDHPDGLFDPAQYFERLQFYYVLRSARAIALSDSRLAAIDWAVIEPQLQQKIARHLAERRATGMPQPLYVAIEKILAVNEELPAGWAIDGTSGYDFLIHLNGLFVDPAGREQLTRTYSEFIGNTVPFSEHVYQDKRLVLKHALSSELQMLTQQADRLAQKYRRGRDFTLRSLRHGLRELVACFPVYRTYITGRGVSEADQQCLHAALEKAVERNPQTNRAVVDFLCDLILQQSPDTSTEEYRADQLRFAGKFQQLTAPVTAKGIEDTAFYRYHRLISLNEVGGDPDHFGTTAESLHNYFSERQSRWPHALSPLSTHDTKRSEDVRARLHALSEIPNEWQEHVLRWREANVAVRPPSMDANDEYLLYQTLLGAWPLEGAPDEEFVRRIQAYMVKALRKSKMHTSWTDPNNAYESAIKKFVAAVVMTPEFLRAFLPFENRVSQLGLFTSLSQTLLRLAAPGAPDTYQGTELWDFSLVDPDNRRPVDYGHRQAMLAQLQEKVRGADRFSLLEELLRNRNDGGIKLFVTWRGLLARRDNPGLFSRGSYVPLAAEGPRAGHVFALLRRNAGMSALVLVPRLLAEVMKENEIPVGAVWKDTVVRMPSDIAGVTMENVFTGESMSVEPGAALALSSILGRFPVGLYVSRPGLLSSSPSR